jgi:hypothetical protein
MLAIQQHSVLFAAILWNFFLQNTIWGLKRIIINEKTYMSSIDKLLEKIKLMCSLEEKK